MKNVLMLALLALGLTVAGCAAQVAPEAEDELAVEDADLGELGAADAVGGENYTYYSVRQDFRRCAWPFCGGFWVARVNRPTTVCADGRAATECYVAELDLAGLGLSPTDTDAVLADAHGGRSLFRATIRRTTIARARVGVLAATEAWRAPGEYAPAGVYVRVEDLGIRCITYPCSSMREEKLNASTSASLAGIDFAPSGASDEEIALAYEALGRDELIIAGNRYAITGPAGRGNGRTVTAFWIRVRESAATSCFVGGCSSQVCSDREGVITTCEWRPEYACYRTATCERQPSGACGWTPTADLTACLTPPRS